MDRNEIIEKFINEVKSSKHKLPYTRYSNITSVYESYLIFLILHGSTMDNRELIFDYLLTKIDDFGKVFRNKDRTSIATFLYLSMQEQNVYFVNSLIKNSTKNIVDSNLGFSTHVQLAEHFVYSFLSDESYKIYQLCVEASKQDNRKYTVELEEFYIKYKFYNL